MRKAQGMSSAVARLVVLISLVLACLAPGRAFAGEEQASALESRLMAPCCWDQTLDVHQSPLAEQLRAEIRARLAAGESEAAIESDMVARYGERVLALRDSRALGGVMIGLGALGLGAALALGLALRRWVRRGRAAAQAAPVAQRPRDADDDRLDEELAAM